MHETVELAKQSGFGPQAGFVNAVLRGYLREFDATKAPAGRTLKTHTAALGYSHPEWLVERGGKSAGAESTRRGIDGVEQHAAETFARVNTLKTDAGKLLAQWRDEDVEYDFVPARLA